jgi:hypothetical protein
MGGNWFLIVPMTNAGGVKNRPPGEVIKSARINLLRFCEPTLLEKWLITIIRVPVAFTIEYGAVPPSLATVRATLTMRRGGDIVWTDTVEVELTTVTESGELVQSGNVVFADNLINAVQLQRGQTLQLELNFTVISGPSSVRLEAFISQTANTANIRPVLVGPDEGTVQYDSETLTGHRTL